VLQNNPEIQKWRERLRLTPKVFLILFAFAATVILARSLQAEIFIFNPILLIPFAILIGVCGRLFGNILWSTRKSLLRLQERALAGDASLLADQQPVPNEQALPFPTIIDWRPKNSAQAFTVIITFLISMAVFLPFIVFIIPPSQLPPTLLAFALGLFGSFVLILVVKHFSAQKSKRQSSGIQASEPEKNGQRG
jgi:membrane protein implicated in regulation of membrane protease activity